LGCNAGYDVLWCGITFPICTVRPDEREGGGELRLEGKDGYGLADSVLCRVNLDTSERARMGRTKLGLFRKIWATAKKIPYAMGRMKHRRMFNYRNVSSAKTVMASRLTNECFESTMKFFRTRARNWRQKRLAIVEVQQRFTIGVSLWGSLHGMKVRREGAGESDAGSKCLRLSIIYKG
jgi:hypothetical protein